MKQFAGHWIADLHLHWRERPRNIVDELFRLDGLLDLDSRVQYVLEARATMRKACGPQAASSSSSKLEDCTLLGTMLIELLKAQEGGDLVSDSDGQL